MASFSDPEFDPAARRGFVPPRTDEERSFMKRVEELCCEAQLRGTARNTGFLSDREQALGQAALNRQKCTCARFWGGYEEAERKILFLNPSGAIPDHSIAVLRLTWPEKVAPPGHRDILGAILGLGLDRNAIGDVLLPEVQARSIQGWVLVTGDKAEWISMELSAAGKCPLHAEVQQELPVEAIQSTQRELRQATVSAMRADVVLSALLRVSRSQAVQLIEAGRAFLNHIPIKAAHERVYVQDLISVQGRGRFRLQAIGGKSKKDRIFVQYYQY